MISEITKYWRLGFKELFICSWSNVNSNLYGVYQSNLVYIVHRCGPKNIDLIIDCF